MNVMLSQTSVKSPPHDLDDLTVRTVVMLCTLGVFALGVNSVSSIVFVHVYLHMCCE